MAVGHAWVSQKASRCESTASYFARHRVQAFVELRREAPALGSIVSNDSEDITSQWHDL